MGNVGEKEKTNNAKRGNCIFPNSKLDWMQADDDDDDDDEDPNLSFIGENILVLSIQLSVIQYLLT